MREIIVHEFITLDGVIQAPGGADEDTDGGFQHGGWTLPYWHDDIGARFFQAMSQTDALLLGRKTWQIHGGAFEVMAGDSFADVMNDMRKYVVSTTLPTASAWRNSTLIRDNVVATIRQIKQQAGKNILIDGSSVLLHTLAQNDLVDEYSLHVYPLALGGGKRLFPDGKRLNLALVETAALPTGVVYMRYRRARAVRRQVQADICYGATMLIEFSGEMWFWRGPAPWYFITVPAEPCVDLRAIAGTVTYGWGMIPVTVRIGNSKWQTSLFPKAGRYIVPIKASVRKAENLEEGDTAAVRMEVR